MNLSVVVVFVLWLFSLVRKEIMIVDVVVASAKPDTVQTPLLSALVQGALIIYKKPEGRHRVVDELTGDNRKEMGVYSGASDKAVSKRCPSGFVESRHSCLLPSFYNPTGGNHYLK